jgi:hypothetical protein
MDFQEIHERLFAKAKESIALIVKENDEFQAFFDAHEISFCAGLNIIVVGYPHRISFDEWIDLYIDKPAIKKVGYYRYIADLDLNPIDDFFVIL